MCLTREITRGKGKRKIYGGMKGPSAVFYFLLPGMGETITPSFSSSEDEEELPIEQIAFFVCGRTN